MTKQVNHVTLFSNGIGHFRRMYHVPTKPHTISIPFKTNSIADVAASFQVFGKVKVSPPSFTPANSNATSLKIDPHDAMKSLLQQLSGAAVNIMTAATNNKMECVLLGLDEQISATPSGNHDDYHVVLQAPHGIIRRSFRELESIEFTEETVKTEIDKARKSNFQKIKPDSTLVEFTLSSLTDGETEAVVQYTIPVAAWKMRYAIRQEGSAFSLEGAAVIDNNTDEDWDNFSISTVTGNPISFLTDIANVVIPTRQFISVVETEALGNVKVEECTRSLSPLRSNRVLEAKMSAANMSNYMPANFGAESIGAQIDMMDAIAELAESPGVDVKEVGDFCVLTHKEPITILARKSAVVPMFVVALKHAGLVLLYKEENHPRRPYRAVKFKNETDYSLGRGKTIIYNDGTFSGECILEATKQGENRMLPHALENGVKIAKATKETETRRNSIQISDGVAIDEQVQTSITEYVVENKRDESFKIALEHVNVLTRSNVQVGFEGADIKESDKLSGGQRVYFELTANQHLVIKVTEVSVWGTTVALKDFGWLTSVVSTYKPLSEDPQIMKCAAIQSQIDDQDRQSQDESLRKTELEQQVQRVRQNLSAVQGKSTELVNKWIIDLDETEGEIRKITKDILPGLQRSKKKLLEELRGELKKILTTWKDEPPKSVKSRK